MIAFALGALAQPACSQRRAPETRPAPATARAPATPAPPPAPAAPSAPPAARASDAAAGQPIAVGQRAPDFELPSTEDNGRVVRLADYRGRRTVVLAFFPRAFTPG